MTQQSREYTPDELERRRALSRERNRRYLAKNDPTTIARRAAAGAAYRDRLKNDPAYALKNEERKRRAVARTKAWQAANPEKVKAHARANRQRNPDKQSAKTMRRNAQKIQATPSWASAQAIARHYESARHLTEVTGHVHHVDHIVPLRGKTVCGLHVEHNLRVVPHYINTRKSNRLEV